MQITSSGGSWVWARRLGVAGTIQLVCGLVALGGFLLPWFAVDLPTYSFHVSGWETALHIGKGALWTALLGALALLGIAALRKFQSLPAIALNLLAFFLAGASLVIVMVALDRDATPVPPVAPAMYEHLSFGLFLTLLGLLIGALSGLVGLFKIKISWNYQADALKEGC